MNKFSTGINFAYDKYDEFVNQIDYSRTDNSIGAFFEYTYDNTTNFSAILGGRVDNHNRLGTFFTPRLHVRYNPWEKSVIRFSAGRGIRSANIFAENQQLFGSSRNFEIINSGGKIYGLNPEIAWNYGLSFNQKFVLFNRNGDFGFDFFRTDFQNQVVVDLYQGPQQVVFYNLNGKSFANSLQIEFNYELVKQLNIRTAYKYYDIQTDYQYVTQERPLQAKHRFFGNLEYQTHLSDEGKQWKFDFTISWNGKQRLPSTISNSGLDSMPDFSPSFSVMNMQISRVFSSTFEVYVGGENIGNYKQEKAILGSEFPFSTAFDTSIIYAPIFGQMYYAGLRYRVK
jgi:outer membrane receptor for ferrienterochelin and colicin